MRDEIECHSLSLIPHPYFWVVFHIDVYPHQPRNPKDVHKIDHDKNAQQTERHRLAVTQNPSDCAHKKEAKETSPNVRNEHRAVIISGFWEVIEVAMRAAFVHIERFFERPTARFEGFALVATGTFQVENAVFFCAFFEHQI